jgi:hypothetical protein
MKLALTFDPASGDVVAFSEPSLGLDFTCEYVSETLLSGLNGQGTFSPVCDIFHSSDV